MRKILWDKINKREATFQYFFDQYGDCYIDTDRYGVNMGGTITIKMLSENHPQYEIKEISMKDE